MSHHLIDSQLQELLEATPVTSPKSWQEVQDATDELAHDPEYVADVLKTRFVLDLLAAMRERNISQTDLARTIGKSRQYVSDILNEEESTNFTIETMTTLALAVGVDLEVSLCRRDCRRVTFEIQKPMQKPAPEAYKTVIQPMHAANYEISEKERAA